MNEASSYGAAHLILGITNNSRSHLRPPSSSSSAAVAKYCAKRVPPSCSVLAVGNGRVVYRRDAAQQQLNQCISPRTLNCPHNFSLNFVHEYFNTCAICNEFCFNLFLFGSNLGEKKMLECCFWCSGGDAEEDLPEARQSGDDDHPREIPGRRGDRRRRPAPSPEHLDAGERPRLAGSSVHATSGEVAGGGRRLAAPLAGPEVRLAGVDGDVGGAVGNAAAEPVPGAIAAKSTQQLRRPSNLTGHHRIGNSISGDR